MRRPFFLYIVAGPLMALSACGGDPPETTTTTAFIALARDFQGYRAWEKFALPAQPMETPAHIPGDRTLFLNRRPVAGSSEFPVGTIVVKETNASDQVFAMVKRGGVYNTEGARGWEWFELKTAAQGETTILWRGVGPPNGEAYGGDASGGCNTCHGAARANDFVHSAPLTLGKLTGGTP